MTSVFNKEKIVNKVILLDIKEIIVNPCQPRKYFNIIELENLAISIKQNGILNPIIARKNLLNKYELISGERRLKACKIAGIRMIPSIIINIDQKQSAILSILENIQREDLTFFEEAKAINCLINEWEVTQEDCALKLGKAQSTIANKLRLLKISNRHQKMILDGNLTERHARAILKLPELDIIRVKVIDFIINNKYNVTQTEQYIDLILKYPEKTENYLKHGLNFSDSISNDQDYVNIKESKKSKKTNIPIVKDIRLFLNSINKAIDTMKNAGVDAYTEKKQTDNYVEYVVRIPIT